jgi:HlyD family secretion protein
VLFTIAQDLTKMQVDTSVDEADIGRVEPDGPASFTVDAFPGQTFAGRVTQIRKAPQVVQNVVTYTVVVAVDNPRGRLLPGMTANVRLVVAEKASVLRVPNAALRFRPTGTDSGDTDGGGAARSGGGEPSVAEIRERLVKGLKLSPEQQTRLDPILEQGRQQMVELRKEGLSPWAHRSRAQRLREATRARIREILTPEQQASFDDFRGGERTMSGRVFVIGAHGKPKSVNVRLGITDGTSTEVLGGDLTEGQEVIVGASGASGPVRPGGAGGGPRMRL